MTETENTDNLTFKYDEIKHILSEIKETMTSEENSDNRFSRIIQTLDGLVSSMETLLNNSENSAHSDEFTIIQTNILEVKRELATMNTNIDDIISNRLGELLSKLTEKVNRLEILTNNAGMDKSVFYDVAVQTEKNIKNELEIHKTNIEDTVKTMSNDITEQIYDDINQLSTNVEKTTDNLKRSIIDIFTKIQEMLTGTENSESEYGLKENIEMLKTGIYNLNIKTEQRILNLGKIIEELDLYTKLQNFSSLKNLPAIGELKDSLNSRLTTTLEEYLPAIMNCNNQEELSFIANNLKKQIYDSIKLILGNVSEYKVDIQQEINPLKQDNSTIKELKNSIDEITSKLDLYREKDTEVGAIVKECANSIIENSEPDRNFIKEILTDIKKNISVMQSGDEETDYTYSMQDIESDVAKIRIYLNELAQNGLSLNVEEFSNELNNIIVMVDSIKQQVNKLDECNLTETIEKIQDDITSISTRVNKLLLTSDNSYNMVECTLKEFKILSQEIDSQIKSLAGTNKFKSIENSIDSVRTALVESNNYNSVINQSLIMLAEWVDSAGEMLTNISERQDKLDNIGDLHSLLYETKNEISDISSDLVSELERISAVTNNLIQESKPADYSEVLNTINNKLTEQNLIIEKQEERINKLDEKLNTILEFVAKNDSSTVSSKLNEIDENMKKLNYSIEKITSYINED